MLNIKILGPGCANCYRLEGLAVAAVQFLNFQKPELFENVDVNLEHLGTSEDFRRYGVLRTPGLVVNEKLAIAGRLPDVMEIIAVLERHLTGGEATAPRAPTGA